MRTVNQKVLIFWIVTLLLVQTHITPVVTALLTGKTISAGMFFWTFLGFFRNIYFPGQTWHVYKRHRLTSRICPFTGWRYQSSCKAWNTYHNDKTRITDFNPLIDKGDCPAVLRNWKAAEWCSQQASSRRGLSPHPASLAVKMRKGNFMGFNQVGSWRSLDGCIGW